MARIVIPYAPREAFKPFHNTKKRFRSLVVHRRAGKTTAIINDQIRAATEDSIKQLELRGIKPQTAAEADMWRNTPRMYPIIEPQLKQAKAVAWGPLKFFASKIPGIKVNESELSITFPGNGVVRLFGSGPQEADAFRGMKFWKVCFDEYQDADPNVWHEIVRPACLDTQAPVTFAGTIKGKNHLYRLDEQFQNDPDWECLWLEASKSGIIPKHILDKERAQYEAEGKLHKYLQEFELEPMAIIEGAIFGKEYFWLKENGHIRAIDHDPVLKVETFWDLGIADYLVVLFFQRYGMESRLVDCLVTHSTSLPEVAGMLEGGKRKEYRYSEHFLPHDARVRELSTGISRVKTLEQLLPGSVRVVDRVKSKEDGISAVRAVYRRLWVDERQAGFIDAFSQYEWEWDEDRKIYLQAPKHNWASHVNDALMQWAQIEYAERKTGYSPHIVISPTTYENLNSAI